MNTIGTDQNEPRQLQRLGAQRQRYATAKKILATQVWLGGPVAIGMAFLAIFFPSQRGYIGLWTILVVLADAFWLTRWQKQLRQQGAKIQELFDCDVLGIPWNTLKVGARPDAEHVKELSDHYLRWASKMPPLENWYSGNGADLPPQVVRVACQRSNCWWDAEQRKRYALIIVACVIGLFVIVLAVALVKEFSLEDLLVRVLVPMVPLFLLGFRQYTEQTEAATRMAALKEHASELWATALAGQECDEGLRASRNLQDEIFESRKRSPLVFDFVFKRLQSRLEIQMAHGMDELFDEARKRMRSKKTI